MNTADAYIAFSYNYGADYDFVVALAAEMKHRGVAMPEPCGFIVRRRQATIKRN